jgi:hypothetical protein
MGTERNKRTDKQERESPGCVAVDSRGRNIWQWNDDQLDSTTIMLQSLDNSSLALEPTLNVRRPDVAGSDESEQRAARASRSSSRNRESKASDLSVEQTISFNVGGGFDPYNRS